jgi:SAM-dependent methyltransferase
MADLGGRADRTAERLHSDVSMTGERSLPADLSDDVTEDGAFHVVRDGYEAIYEGLPRGETFNRVWRTNAYRGEFPIEFAHIGFLTEAEGRRVVELLRVRDRQTLVDLACGAGGPGLWTAQQSGAALIGVDPAEAGLTAARQRARAVGLSERSEFRRGSFEQTGLEDGVADAAMTIEAFQYAPDKRAALTEFARILNPGARVAIMCFEVDPAKVRGLPVLGVDPVPDYEPLLTDAGLSTARSKPWWMPPRPSTRRWANLPLPARFRRQWRLSP